jgi:excisionase family DNA binding protein
MARNLLNHYRPDDPLLTPAEVARIFRVNPKTVTRWARTGKLASLRTVGGHRRFYRSDVERFLPATEAIAVS